MAWHRWLAAYSNVLSPKCIFFILTIRAASKYHPGFMEQTKLLIQIFHANSKLDCKMYFEVVFSKWIWSWKYISRDVPLFISHYHFSSKNSAAQQIRYKKNNANKQVLSSIGIPQETKVNGAQQSRASGASNPKVKDFTRPEHLNRPEFPAQKGGIYKANENPMMTRRMHLCTLRAFIQPTAGCA